MGIKGLQRLLNNRTNITSMCHFLKYRTKTIAIDTNILIYKFCYKYSYDINSFIICFIQIITSFLKYGILPVFIFDGTMLIEKKSTISKRKYTKFHLRKRLENLRKLANKTHTTSLQIQRLERQSFMVSKHHHNSLITLLSLLGIPYFISKGEAEMLCALLQKKGVIDYTLTEDTDAYAFGCLKVVKMCTTSEKYLIETDFSKFLNDEHLDYETFLNACVLSGCDYNDKYIHIEDCLELVKKYDNLKELVESFNNPSISIEKCENTKNIYKFKHIEIKPIIEQCDEIDTLKLGEFRFKEFIRFINTERKISLSKSMELTDLIKNSINEYSIINVNFFSKHVNK